MSGAPAPRRSRYAAPAEDERHAAHPPRDRPRKRSLSPDSSHDQRPNTRRRSTSPAARHRRSEREHYSRSSSQSPARKPRPEWDRRSRNASQDRSYAKRTHRNRSRSSSRELTSRRRRGSSASRSASLPRRRRRSHSRSASPPRRRRRSHSRGASPPPRRRRDRDDDRSRSRSPPVRARKPLPSQLDSYRADPTTDVAPPAPKEKVNWKTTGALAAETNTVQISSNEKIVLKYHEPSDARKPPPSSQWRLYIFKGDQSMGDVQLSSQSCWLIGREEKVADLLVEHPSCSKQHAVLQFRFAVKKQEKEMGVDDFLAEFGEGSAGGGKTKEKGTVRPYLLDLESANGTTLNGERIEPTRFVELREKDVIKFGLSEREYVLLKE